VSSNFAECRNFAKFKWPGHISVLREATVTWLGMLLVLHVAILCMLIWPWSDPNSRSRSVTLTLTLDQVKIIHINMHNTCSITSMPDHVNAASRSMEIWPFEFQEIDIPWSLNSRDSFVRRKFENWAQTSCRPGAMLSATTISFELHAKIAEEIDLEKCDFRNLRSSVTLTLRWIGSRSHWCTYPVETHTPH